MKTYTILLISMLLFVMQSCDIFESDSDSTGNGISLLQNGSFENLDSPSLAGWDSAYIGTSVYSFSTDVPPSGGKFSIRLNNYPALPFWLGQFQQLPSGISNGVRLTFWAKSDSIHGHIALGVIRSGTILVDTTIAPQGSSWTFYSVDLNYSSQAGDSVGVYLWSKWSPGPVSTNPSPTGWDQICLYGKN